MANVEEDKLLQQYFNTGTKLKSDSPTSCYNRGQIKDLSVEAFMMTNLSVIFLKKEVLSTQEQVLPCGLLECKCESTSLDPFAFIWNAPHNCIVKLFDRKVKMIKYSSKINQYFFISERDKDDVINFYRTNVESLFYSL